MVIVQINGGSSGSTGKIIKGISQIADQNGFTTYYASPITTANKSDPFDSRLLRIGTFWGRRVSVLLSRITGLSGCFSRIATKRFLKKLDTLHPSVIHLHSLHDSYINLPLLFKYIKRKRMKVIWTLHDCWSFTGHCPHFIYDKCEKWKNGCLNCPRYREYPKSIFDNSKLMWRLKNKWFTSAENLTIVTPSYWLCDLVKQSFLSEYSIAVINNGIDLNVFKPIPSDFCTQFGLQGKRVILGVSYGWNEKKGIDVFVELSKRLNEAYKIVLVGTDDNLDKKLPSNILSIHCTQNQNELAAIYSSADVFVNPTREDNYPTVNMESLACGTPVITFDAGGGAEMVDDTCGSVVKTGDFDGLLSEIIRVCETQPYAKTACLEKAKTFDMRKRYEEYIDLYREVAK